MQAALKGPSPPAGQAASRHRGARSGCAGFGSGEPSAADHGRSDGSSCSSDAGAVPASTCCGSEQASSQAPICHREQRCRGSGRQPKLPCGRRRHRPSRRDFLPRHAGFGEGLETPCGRFGRPWLMCGVRSILRCGQFGQKWTLHKKELEQSPAAKQAPVVDEEAPPNRSRNCSVLWLGNGIVAGGSRSSGGGCEVRVPVRYARPSEWAVSRLHHANG